MIDLATRGRKRGFCAILATQRLSKLHKDAAAECNNKLIGRSALDVDMTRAAEELGLRTKDDKQQTRHLKAGEFFAFGPAISDQVTRVSIGAVHTTHPKSGGRRVVTTPPPTEKVKQLLAKLSDLPAEVEEREKTLADLKRDNATLRCDLTLAKKAQPEAVVERTEVSVLTDADRALLTSASASIESAKAEIVSAIEQAADGMADALGQVRRVVGDVARTATEVQAVAVKAERSAERSIQRCDLNPASTLNTRVSTRVSAPSTGDAPALGKCERAILTVLSQHPDGCVLGKLTLLSGYQASGGFKNALSTLRTAGLITGPNTGVMQITDGGWSALGDVEPLPTGDGLIDYWQQHGAFGANERAVIGALRDGGALTLDELAAATGYQVSGGFRNALSKLRTAGVLVGRNTEAMRLHEELVGV